jgi:hypothetical protein
MTTLYDFIRPKLPPQAIPADVNPFASHNFFDLLDDTPQVRDVSR